MPPKTIKERLLAKLQAKKGTVTTSTSSTTSSTSKDNKGGSSFSSIKFETKPVFEIILNQQHSLKNSLVDQEDIETNSIQRLIEIQKMVDTYVDHMKPMPPEQLTKGLKKLNLTIDPRWIQQHLSCLNRLAVSDKAIMHNSYLIKYYNHTIIGHTYKVSKAQIYTDFLGLIWLQKYATEDQDNGRDVICSIEGYNYFMCLTIGLEFFAVLKQSEFLKPYAEHLDIYDMTVYHHEYGPIKMPPLQLIEGFGYETVKMHAYWTSYYNKEKDEEERRLAYQEYMEMCGLL